MNQKRLELLRLALVKKGLDAVLITKKENIFYLSGFLGDGMLLITSDSPTHFITSAIFAEQARSELLDVKIDVRDGSWPSLLKKIIKKAKIRRLGFECNWISHMEFAKLDSTLKKAIRLIPQKNLVEHLRMIKDRYELGCLKEAVSILKKTYLHIKEIIKPDMTEDELSRSIDSFFLARGAERSAFRTIIAGMTRSAYPHALPSKNRLGRRGQVLVDMGCVYKEYCSDLTRMFFLGKIGAKFKSVYAIVKAAQARALRKIRPGVRISEIDYEARQHLANKRLGKFFIHNLGHGIGLDIHEEPIVSKKNKNRLRQGMVFTVEPGVYIPGWGGVRVEDMVLVTEKGCEVLTGDIPK